MEPVDSRLIQYPRRNHTVNLEYSNLLKSGKSTKTIATDGQIQLHKAHTNGPD